MNNHELAKLLLLNINCIEARSHLPALLRRLIHNTGENLVKVDFPAHDNSQRHGWDGVVIADTAVPWIPKGKSGWEFGVNKKPEVKANSDYETRTKNTLASERKDTTFVFVTPRNWPAKTAWEKIKREENEWKDVRAFDADDLEQWLEQAIPAQNWFAERIGIRDDTITSLEECWRKWAFVTEPKLNKVLFSGLVTAHKARIEQWLENEPSQPLIVASESYNETLAFLACALESVFDALRIYDQAVVITSESSLEKVTMPLAGGIVIVASPEAEKALSGSQKRQHTIIIRHKASVAGEPDISLDIPAYDAFRDSLIEMGIDEQEISRYARESGLSPTILRRRLSQVQAVRFPPWVQDRDSVRSLIPLIFVGTWESNNKADQNILKYIADSESYEDIERTVADCVAREDPPVWSVGYTRGVISKIDALFAASNSITLHDIERFFDAAGVVLCEDNPALDLPEDDQWMASFYGKTRDHSRFMRKSLCETLVLLSVHGNNLFKARLGLDIEAKVNYLISELLKPLDSRNWLSQQSDLPLYAEAAPEVFLEILKEDLDSETPQIYTLLEPVGSGVFGRCPRSGLLWALEALAWKPERLARVSSILAKLSKREIDDNWSNKPINSLLSIFRSWMPQTAADITQRKSALEYIVNNYPYIGWKICIDQFDPMSRVGHYNYRPLWRNDASGVGQPNTGPEDIEFRRFALELALKWDNHDETTLISLVKRLGLMPDNSKREVWQLINKWAESNPSELQKAKLRETIRLRAFTKRAKNLSADTKDHARESYALLEPSDIVIRHQWLFRESWVDESSDELDELRDDEDYDYTKREERVQKQRIEALKEIYHGKGVDGIRKLIATSNAAYAIGWHLGKGVLTDAAVPDTLHQLLTEDSMDLAPKFNECIAGLLGGQEPEVWRDLMEELVDRIRAEDKNEVNKIVRLFRCAPFLENTFILLDGQPSDIQNMYWSDVNPGWHELDSTRLGWVLNKLIEAGRPRAAFFTAHMKWESLGSGQIVRILQEIGSKAGTSEESYHLEPYHIAKAFQVLNTRGDMSTDELANLEFLYLGALRHNDFGIPNLEKQISTNPILFAQALALAFRRNDDGNDPKEWTVSDPDRKNDLALAGHALLDHIKTIPGTKADGSIDQQRFVNWISETRALCKKYGRAEIGDQKIGEVLSRCPIGEDSVWPCEPLRQPLDDIASKNIALGMSVGICNARGATWRGKGGDQERVLAEKYRNWSRRLAFEHPFVADLVEKIAVSFEDEAKYWDMDADRDRRIGY
jgi:hypothetical protein